MNMPKLSGAAAILLACTNAYTTELVYVPINPSFGGNPLNGSVLLNSAQATKKHEEPKSTASGLRQQTPLERFNETLERAILSRLASSLTGELFNNQGDLQPGTVETANFTISISDLGNGTLMITTTDKVTGDSTSFQVGQ